jgi:hypothetical protein
VIWVKHNLDARPRLRGIRVDWTPMKPRARRIALPILLPALLSVGCTEPSSVLQGEPEPLGAGTTKVRVEILALVYGEEGFRCDYEILEDAGRFRRGKGYAQDRLARILRNRSWRTLETASDWGASFTLTSRESSAPSA